jgi:hypothetical protein
MLITVRDRYDDPEKMKKLLHFEYRLSPPKSSCKKCCGRGYTGFIGGDLNNPMRCSCRKIVK